MAESLRQQTTCKCGLKAWACAVFCIPLNGCRCGCEKAQRPEKGRKTATPWGETT